MWFFVALFGIVLALCAWSDWKEHRVQDIHTAVLWCLLPLFSGAAYAAAGTFALVYLLNACAALGWKKPVLSWADVLGFPPFFAVEAALFGQTGAFLAVLALVYCLGVSILRRKEVPLFPFMFAFFVLGLLIHSLFPTLP